MKISWKHDNRDVIRVTDARSYGQAYDAAADFVQAAGDEYCISYAQAEGDDTEDGTYEFPVKTY